MAFSPSESPAVTIREVDLSGIVPAVTSSTGAIVGDFNWGPTNQPILIGNEAELVSNFGSPSLVIDSSNVDFLSASSFLKYSGSLYVTRGLDAAAKNAVDSASSVGNSPVVEGLSSWNSQKSGFMTSGSNRLVAKYPGEVGNSLAISICPWSGIIADGGTSVAVDGQDSAFNAWAL